MQNAGETRLRAGMWSVCFGFCLASAAGFFFSGQFLSGLICLGSVILVCLPFLLEKLLRLRMSQALLAFCLLYALGPMLGKAFRLYYLTAWWDKLLHTCGGVAFGVLGACVAKRLGGTGISSGLCALFGLCFSVAVAAVWELFEYGVDCLFDADMQQDTVVSAIHSHYLSETAGVLRSIREIREVMLDGVALGVGGYLDIGLNDTMQDMLVETGGAAAYYIWYLLAGERYPLLRPADSPRQ